MKDETGELHIKISNSLPSDEEVLQLSDLREDVSVVQTASSIRNQEHPTNISFSKKVFIPLTHLCRDVCHYCTFAQVPRQINTRYLRPEEVLRIAESGAQAGCKEALFTLGDKPELRYEAARKSLKELKQPTPARSKAVQLSRALPAPNSQMIARS